MTDKTPTEDKSEKAPTVIYKYDGSGDYVQGIPARDLTKDDVDALSDEQKADLSKSRLYKKGGR